MAQTVADIPVGTLEQIGGRHIFGLIGDSLNPFADAVRRSKIEWIGVRSGESRAKISEGFAADGPVIIDCVVAANQMPNSPHRELDKIGHSAIAKIKEALIAATGP